MEFCSVLCAWMGRGLGVQAHVWLSSFTVHLKPSQHCQTATAGYKKLLVLKIKINFRKSSCSHTGVCTRCRMHLFSLTAVSLAVLSTQ